MKLLSFLKHWSKHVLSLRTPDRMLSGQELLCLHCFSPLCSKLPPPPYSVNQGLYTWNGGNFEIKHITFELVL